MFFVAVTRRMLLDLYLSIDRDQSLTQKDMVEQLKVVRAQVLLCRCPKAADTYQLFLDLISLRSGFSFGSLALSANQRVEIAQGWSASRPSLHDRILEMSTVAETSASPETVRAFRVQLEVLERILGDPNLAAKYRVTRAVEYEDQLRRDPSRPELWIAAAKAHKDSGNDERARQLLRRACASAFSEQSSAQILVANWIKDGFASR